MAEVAIIMPTYNRPVSLPYAIESVLSQSFVDWKLYVIGDGDTDGGEKTVRRFMKKAPGKIVWKNLKQNHGGVHTNKIVTRGDTGACARNTGFFMSSEPFIAYLDDDDSFRRDHIQLLYNEISKKRWDLVFSRGAIWRKPNISSYRPGVVGGPVPALARIGTNSLMHTRKIATKVLIPIGDQVTVPLTGKTWPAGIKVLRFPCCRAHPGLLWLPAKVCEGCHDWDMVKRMMGVGAKWRFVPRVTYDIFWDMSQNQFKEFVVQNRRLRSITQHA